MKRAGHYAVYWDGLNNRGESIPSGIYFYMMKAEEFTNIKKMIMMK
jgi:hypothetical protein